jgi:hypothetical protein
MLLAMGCRQSTDRTVGQTAIWSLFTGSEPASGISMGGAKKAIGESEITGIAGVP